MKRPSRVIFLAISPVNRLLQALAASEDRTHGNLATIDHYHSARLFEKCAIPTTRLQTPRPHKDATFNDHRPDANDPVRLCACADAEDIPVANLGDDGFRETT